jgi:hypothetical protein
MLEEISMRSCVPIPGNPWPHDMALTIEDDTHTLVDLLWVREAWNLNPAGDDLPPLLSNFSAGAQHETTLTDKTSEWQEAWSAIWLACLQHAGQIRDPSVFEQLRQTANGSVERLALLEELVGPSWRDSFGDEAFTEQYQIWNQAQFETSSRRHLQSLDEEPERVSLAAVIPAWQAGMTKVVVIPCKGTYSRVIGQHALLVTAETRDDPARYGEALGLFQ